MKREILSYFHGNLRATAKKILFHIDRLGAFNIEYPNYMVILK